ncbi:MAG: nucleotidyl transferase AbiEii/AbiGii toxin family protein [archaeon]
MRIPLSNRLKKRLHTEIALLQDEVIDIVYSIEEKAVLHGGTALWRCYSGNRFSEDLDFYLNAGEKFEKEFRKKLESRGLQLKKYKKTGNAVYSKISNGTTEVRFEAALRKPKEAEAREYERADGSFSTVFTLPPEKLLEEKMNAYKNRKLIRDLYDVFMLSTVCSENKELNKKAKEFLEKLPEPADEKNLKTIVFSGAIPSSEQMVNAIKRRFK